MPLPARQSRDIAQQRAMYARTNQPIGDLLVNQPGGFPSDFPPGVPTGGTGSPVWWWGSDQWVRPLEPARAMAAITRATALIVNTLSSLPWRVLTGGATLQQSNVELVPPRWLTDPMLVRPDDRFGFSTAPAAIRLPRSAFWAQWIRSALWAGMGFLVFEEDAAGQPVAGTLRVLNPGMVTAQDSGGAHRRISDGSGFVDTDFDGYFPLGGRRYRLVELGNPTAPVNGDGMARGVLEIHAAELALAGQSLAYAQSMFRSGVPSGYLKVSIPNYPKAKADQLRGQWLEYHGGDDRSVAVLNATTDFVPLAFKPIDMDLINARRMSLLDIANAFGIPPYYLGADDSTSNTYSSAESRNLDLRQSLLHWSVAAEDVLTSLIPTGQWVEVDFRGLMRPDTKTRYESYSMALRDGWLTVAEVRQLESLGPLPEVADVDD